MKPKKSPKKLRITQADYMLAQRRAARMEEIAEHGKPVSLRSAVHRSKKVYDRKRLKKIDFDETLRVRVTSRFFGRLLQISAELKVTSLFSGRYLH